MSVEKRKGPMQGNQIMSVVADQNMITETILSHIGEDGRQIRSRLIYCQSAQEAINTLSSKIADFVLVLSENNEPISNIVEYIKDFNFEDKSLPIVLYFKEQD